MSAVPIVFSVPEYSYLRDSLCGPGSGLEPGEVDTYFFPDGERYLRIVTAVVDRHVVVVAGTVSDAATLTLYDLASAAVKYRAERLTLLIPYYGYSTMDHAVAPGEVVVAKTRARLLSAIPPASHGNRLVLFDLHNEGIAYYFEGEVTAVHVYGWPLIVQAARNLWGDQFVLATADAGRAKWVQSLANELGVDVAFVFKRRLGGATTEVTAVSAQVAGKRVLIYDDMIRTGGSLMGAARAYLDAGAAEIAVVATHGVFVGDTLDLMRHSGLFSHIMCTDSHPRAHALRSQGLDVLAVAPLLGSYLHK